MKVGESERKNAYCLQLQSTVGVAFILMLLFNPISVVTLESSTTSPAILQSTDFTTDTGFTSAAIMKKPAHVFINEECRVPVDASINYEKVFSAPITNDSQLVEEAKCYIACMELMAEPRVGYLPYLERQTHYPPWPYNTLSKDADCPQHQYVHECTRGCVIALHNEKNCESVCHTNCTSECRSQSDQCGNPDPDEWWVRKTCDLRCDYSTCSFGCRDVNTNCDKSDCQPPLTPAAPPTLTPVVNSTRAGMYTINLTHTVPPSPFLSHNVAFLFEIQDNTTGNYSYHWLVDPRTTQLDLADFSCREVTVRFAVANLNGLSGFSESFRIPQVYGARKPYPVANISVSQIDDTRVGYFGHVIWNITWDPPENQLHLEGYTIEVYNPNPDEFLHCGQRVWTQTLNTNETSVKVSTDQRGQVLVMGCDYIVEVHALGLDENVTERKKIKSRNFPSNPHFINGLQCNTTWDSTKHKLCFNLTWTLPLYFADADPVARYIVSVEQITVSKDTVDAQLIELQYAVPPIIQPNETEFYHCVAQQEDGFPTPHSNHKFRFNLSFISKLSDFPPALSGTEEPFVCITNADPYIMSVQFTADTFLKLGVPSIVTVIVIAVVLFILIYLCVKLKKKTVPLINETPTSLELIFSGQSNHHTRTRRTTNLQLLEPDEWEISFSEVIIENQLGTGEFGKVHKGVVRGPLQCSKLRPALRNGIAVPVAVKMLKETAVGNEKKNFLSEIDMMKMISEGHHPNVIGLVGCVTIQEPLCLILEVASFGNFLSYLRTNRQMEMEEEGTFIPGQMYKMEQLDLINFPFQIASGMEYLSSKGIVHRDLACRNILVDMGKVLKITDFGLSRKVDNDEIYVQRSKGRVPLKWMSPESILTCEFTTASDVWSYGIALWEIGTMGGCPYPSHSNDELCPSLKGGYRMGKPEKTSPEVYNIMLSCWDGDPRKRPTFTELRTKFDEMLQLSTDYFHPVNTDNQCSCPENASKKLASSVPPVPTLLSSSPIQNQMSLGVACPNELTSSQSSGNPRGRRSTPTTSDRIPQHRVCLNPFPHDSTLRAATGSANTLVAQNKDPSRAKNLYVKDPSEQLLQVSTQARPSKMLIPSPSADAIYSHSTSSLVDSHNGGRYRHKSMIALNIEAAANENVSES